MLKNSEFDAARAELESTKRCLCFAKDAASLMQERAQNQGPQIREVKAVYVAEGATQAAGKSSVQSLTASELVLQGKFRQLTRPVRDVGDEVVKRRQLATVRCRTSISSPMA